MSGLATPAALLAAFDAGVTEDDAQALADLFADDAEMLILFQEEVIVGRDRILAFWSSFFSESETVAWQMDARRIDVHGEHAYVVADYSEVFRPRAGGARSRIVGRLVLFLGAQAGRWYIDFALNSHAKPIETLE